jgi:hypothetical protein
LGEKEGSVMKKLLALLFLGVFLMGCGAAATQSEFWQHSSMYKNWDHMRYSLTGYTNPTAETGEMSQDQGWWGIDVPYIPAK